MGAPCAGTWSLLFNTDAEAFGGSGLGDPAPRKTVNTPCHDQEQALSIDLPPMSTVIYRCIRRSPVRKKKETGKEISEKKAVPKGKKAGDGSKSAAAKTAARKTKAAARPGPKAKSES